MEKASLISKVEDYVKQHISEFHQNRIEKLKKLKLKKLLVKKNPYLYRAKDLNTPEAVVRSLSMAFLSSAEETMFGDWLEGLAVYVASEVYHGYKSSAEGIDLEMDKDDVHYMVSIKSGPNWSNSSSMAKQIQNFRKAERAYHTGGNKRRCEAIEGCCYGSAYSEKDSHTKLCGQKFWAFISGDDSLYTDIIEPMGANAHAMNEAYSRQFNQTITKFTKEFSELYCDSDGHICWDKIVKLNSGAKKA